MQAVGVELEREGLKKNLDRAPRIGPFSAPTFAPSPPVPGFYL